jgi:hypothetical protein
MIEQHITRAELCARLKVHPNTCRRWELAGKLTPCGIVGGFVRYREAEVQSLLREMSRNQHRKPGPKPKHSPAMSTASPSSSSASAITSRQ